MTNIKNKRPNSPKNKPASKETQKRPDLATSSTSNELLIQAETTRPLSKVQTTFNNHVRRIASLQNKLLQSSAKMDEHLVFYQQKVAPMELELYGTRKVLIKSLFTFYKRRRKGITQPEHERLRKIIEEQLFLVLEREDDPDDELKAIYKKVIGESFNESMAGDFETAKEELIEHLRDFGYDIADDTFDEVKDFADLQNAFEREMEKQYALYEEELEADVDDDERATAEEPSGNSPKAEKPEKKKTAAQLKKELLAKEKEALKNRNIGIIYKQLAKIFHPDLEPDPQKKVEKEVLMKELTAAYSKRDLHTLLKLELSWIHQADNNAANLADDKLRVYNEILKEQIAELKRQVDGVKAHPKYRELYVVCEGSRITQKKLLTHAEYCEQMAWSMKDTITLLERNDANSIREIKSIIGERAAADEQLDQIGELFALAADQGMFDDMEGVDLRDFFNK